MTVVVYPLDAVVGSPEYSGRMLRDTLSAVLGGATEARPLGTFSGVRPGTPDSTIELLGSSWTVHAFAGVLDVQAAAEAGPYLFAVNEDVTGDLDAANGTNPRIDILSIQLSDPAESDGTSVPQGELIYTAGTPLGSPVAPSTPDRALKVAQFAVPKSGTGDPTVTWVAPVLRAAGGQAEVASVAALASLPGHEGAKAEVLSTPGAIWRHDGSDWVMHGIAEFGDDSARSTAIDSPVQGMRTRLASTGRVYVYYALYNSGTNPQGRATAGWYKDAPARIEVQHTASSGGNSGTLTSGSWLKRPLNTTVLNEIGGASIASDVITLPPGTYRVRGGFAGYFCLGHRVRLRQTSGTAADVLYGTAGFSNNVNPGSQESSVLEGTFTIAASQTFEVQHWCNTTRANNGMGVAASLSGIGEIFANLLIEKIG